VIEDAKTGEVFEAPLTSTYKFMKALEKYSGKK
jgi:hypothetical protein